MKSKGYLVPLKETKALSSLVYLADAFKRAGADLIKEKVTICLLIDTLKNMLVLRLLVSF